MGRRPAVLTAEQKARKLLSTSERVKVGTCVEIRMNNTSYLFEKVEVIDDTAKDGWHLVDSVDLIPTGDEPKKRGRPRKVSQTVDTAPPEPVQPPSLPNAIAVHSANEIDKIAQATGLTLIEFDTVDRTLLPILRKPKK